MSADVYTTATTLAVLQAGRTPVWEEMDPDDALTPPAAASDGVNLESACRVLVHVSLRENPAYRTVRIETDGVLTGTYTISLNGGAAVATYDATAGAPASEAALMTAIAAAINADGDANDIVSATAVDANDTTTGTLVAVRLRGVSEEDYSIEVTHSGAAVITVTADLASATLRPWWAMGARAGSTPPSVWAWSGDEYTIDRRGLVERFECAGLSRLFVQLSDRIGVPGDGASVTYTDPVISVGPCLSEADT